MRHPMLTDIGNQKNFIDVFGGYNHNLRISDAEFYDMENLSSDGYPMLSTRPPRGKTELPEVYDMVRVNTHKYKFSDPPVHVFCSEGDKLYMACNDGVYTDSIGADCVESEAQVKWFAESGEIGCGDPGRKYLIKLRLRAVLPAGSELQIFTSYDDGDFVPCTCVVGYGITPIEVPFVPRRCDRFRLRLEGIGPCSLLSIYKETESGEI